MDAAPPDPGRQAATALSMGELEELIMAGAQACPPAPPPRSALFEVMCADRPY